MSKSIYQKIRLGFLTISTVLFPVTFYYLSPVISIRGSISGIVSGSLIVFAILLVLSIFLGRSFCSWLCPAGSIQDQIGKSRTKKVKVKSISWLKYIVWGAWLSGILFLFMKAGGVKGINFTFATMYGFSTTDIYALIAYSSVVLTFVILSLVFGRRAACHTICWISPFMIIGKKIAEGLNIPQLHLKCDSSSCVNCGKCDKVCPMSLPVEKLVQSNQVKDNNCILCGECKDSCPKKLFNWNFKRLK